MSKLVERWVPEQGVIVEISGEIRDPVSIAGYVAHHLSHVLADWTTIGQLLESGRGADETALAAVLHDAAYCVRDPGACRCETPVGDFAPDHASAEAATLHDHATALLDKRKPERPPTLREILQKQRSERPASGAIGGRAEPANGGPNGVAGDGENGKRESPAGDHEGPAGVGPADR
jgi:hypothetical protein